MLRGKVWLCTQCLPSSTHLSPASKTCTVGHRSTAAPTQTAEYSALSLPKSNSPCRTLTSGERTCPHQEGSDLWFCKVAANGMTKLSSSLTNPCQQTLPTSRPYRYHSICILEPYHTQQIYQSEKWVPSSTYHPVWFPQV